MAGVDFDRLGAQLGLELSPGVALADQGRRKSGPGHRSRRTSAIASTPSRPRAAPCCRYGA